MTEDIVRARVRVSGRVQGVYYRQATANEARAAGVSGWVRNLADGSVEAAIEGPRKAVERVVASMSQGPPRAHVERMDLDWERPEGESGFRITG